MNTEQTIRNEIGLVLAMPPAEILPDKPLVEYGLDSVRAMDMVVGVEDLFDIEVEDMEIAALKTLNDVIGMVENKLA